MRISLPWDDDVYGTMGPPPPAPPPPPRSSSHAADKIPTEVLQEILLRLPTKDVARSCCVSTHWRGAAIDPSFRKLHAASHAALSPEPGFVRLSSAPCGLGPSIVKTDVFNTGSPGAKAMCSLVTPYGYVVANVCNGLMCFMDRHDAWAPAVVCNPATAETLVLPKAPPLATDGHQHLFALGFSPPDNEYKLFRLSFPPHSYSAQERVDVDVYTLGDAAGGWRKHCFLLPSRPTTTRNSTLLIDGKLYVVTGGWSGGWIRHEADGVLVVDVPSETCRIYPLPNEYLRTFTNDIPLAFELKGRLCLAAHKISISRHHSSVLRFWVMAMENSKELDGEKVPHWELRYSFFIEPESPFPIRKPWSAWFQDGTICYTRMDTLHKYDTRSSSVPNDHGRLLQWNKQPLRTTSSYWRWGIYRGYRPTLISPRIFELPPSQDEKL